MKRLLFLAHRIPYPPDKGDKIRSYREWKALVDEFDVTLACFIDDPADEAHLPFLREHFREVIAVPLKPLPAKLRSLAGLLGNKPLSLAYYADSTMRRLVSEAAARAPFDVVWVFSSQVAPYADCAPNTRRILDLCDLDSEKWLQFADASGPPKSWLYSLEGKRLGKYEVELASRFDATLLVSPAEARTLSERSPGSRVEVVPNGVDLDFLDPAPFDGVTVDHQTCCFCGYMDYLSNIDAVKFFHDDVLPLVRREMPDARFKIIGANPAPE
ncbi:MAG: glycosyltransferase, partial [Planctomycetota bacterium]